MPPPLPCVPTFQDQESKPSDNAYIYTNLDETSLTNVADREVTLWVHLISVYVISCFVYRVRFGAQALAYSPQLVGKAASG